MLDFGEALAAVHSVEWKGKGVKKAAHVGASWLDKLLKKHPRRVRLLTYREVVDYFVHERPDDPKLSSGVLLRRNSPKGKEIDLIQVFLDCDNKLVCHPDGTPFGQIIFARAIDRELQEAFGETDMIIVK